MIVTGGTNIFQIESGSVVRLYDDSANFTGITEYNGYLYTIATKTKLGLPPTCSIPKILDPDAMSSMVSCLNDVFTDRVLLAVRLQPGKIVFREIYTIHDIMIPNGMVANGKGNLIIANTTFMQGGGMIKLEISPSDPETITTQSVWADSKNGVIDQRQL
ncbi:hypothetical protein [Desulforegula conservatrix]|uniref:hypothetical protein n=1 Tax=Desulforegula conservatrix TaxID=153026 RepID=UPI0004117832|nr:hypothetical protein [Desulforegula conservatrix]